MGIFFWFIPCKLNSKYKSIFLIIIIFGYMLEPSKEIWRIIKNNWANWLNVTKTRSRVLLLGPTTLSESFFVGAEERQRERERRVVSRPRARSNDRGGPGIFVAAKQIGEKQGIGATKGLKLKRNSSNLFLSWIAGKVVEEGEGLLES